MMPKAFDYEKPGSVEEATALLKQYGPRARVLAGGQSLLLLLKARAVEPEALIDIGGLAELRGIHRDDGSVTIGAMTTQKEVIESEVTRGSLPIFSGDVLMIADPMVRNRGTLGGALAFATPAGDWPAIALALNAQLHVRSAEGSRTIPVDGFFLDSFKTALEPTELLTHITIPIPKNHASMVYRKMRHPASGYALVGVAVVLDHDEDGVCSDCRIAITGAGRRAVRATAVEDALRGRRLSPELIGQAAERATEGIDFMSDPYAGEEYRGLLARTYVKRALTEVRSKQ